MQGQMKQKRPFFYDVQWGRPAWGQIEKGIFCQKGQHPLLSNWSAKLTESVVHA